jgi:beta-lactamase class A
MGRDCQRTDSFLRRYFFPVALFFLGCFVGYLFKGQDTDRQMVELRQGGWEYVNPLLECEQQGTHDKEELRPIHHDVEWFIANRVDKQWAAKVDVYFRALNDGPSFTIGNVEKFHPASLLKLPLMIAVLRQAESDPSLLGRRVRIDKQTLEMIPYPSERPLEAGGTYTVDELVRHMIVYSDNVATYMLGNIVDESVVSHTYADLGLTNPYVQIANPPVTVALADYQITILDYASFLRVLYNASLLSKTMSEKALRLLTETEFRSGLVAGVPPGIKVAHKWGTRLVGQWQEIKELHDCGIVYYPSHPYLLCVMTSGSSIERQDDAVREISRTVYENVQRQHPQ